MVRLYRELGFYDRRLREAEQGRPARRGEAREALAAMGLAAAPAGEEA